MLNSKKIEKLLENSLVKIEYLKKDMLKIMKDIKAEVQPQDGKETK